MLFISRFIKKDQPYVIQIKSDTRHPVLIFVTMIAVLIPHSRYGTIIIIA